MRNIFVMLLVLGLTACLSEQKYYRSAELPEISNKCLRLKKNFALVPNERSTRIDVFGMDSGFVRQDGNQSKILGVLQAGDIVKVGNATTYPRGNGDTCIRQNAEIVRSDVRSPQFEVPFCGGAVQWLEWVRREPRYSAAFNLDDVTPVACPAKQP